MVKASDKPKLYPPQARDFAVFSSEDSTKKRRRMVLATMRFFTNVSRSALGHSRRNYLSADLDSFH